MIVTDRDRRGRDQRDHPPIRENTLRGTVIAGLKIDNDLAKRIASETGSPIFFGDSRGVIASSDPAGEKRGTSPRS